MSATEPPAHPRRRDSPRRSGEYHRRRGRPRAKADERRPCRRAAGGGLQLLNKDGGFVRPGQRATVKIEGFPFARCGLVPGEVTRVSADAVDDPALGLVYPLRASLVENRVLAGSRGASSPPAWPPPSRSPPENATPSASPCPRSEGPPAKRCASGDDRPWGTRRVAREGTRRWRACPDGAHGGTSHWKMRRGLGAAVGDSGPRARRDARRLKPIRLRPAYDWRSAHIRSAVRLSKIYL